MIGGVWFIFARLKAKNAGFGPNSLKALGLVLFLPTLLIDLGLHDVSNGNSRCPPWHIVVRLCTLTLNE